MAPWFESWFAFRNLDLQERVLTADKLSAEAINALDKGPVEKREQALDKVSRLGICRGLDLRYANLGKAVLPKLDLRPEGNGAINTTRLEGPIWGGARCRK